MSSSGPVLLYDGTCGFCAGSVQFVLKHDRRGIVRFAPLESAFGRAVLQRHAALAGIDSFVWIDLSPADAARDRVLTRSAAALRVAKYLGWPWRLATVVWLVPRPLRDFFYDVIARHRHHLSRGRKQCLVPSSTERDRFLL